MGERRVDVIEFLDLSRAFLAGARLRVGLTGLTVAEMYLEHIFPAYTRTHTTHALAGSGIEFPPVGAALLDRQLDRLIADGFKLNTAYLLGATAGALDFGITGISNRESSTGALISIFSTLNFCRCSLPF